MENKKTTENSLVINSIVLLAVIALIVSVSNLVQISRLTTGTSLQEAPTKTTAISLQQGIDVIPKGTPEIYGEELGIKYDDVSPTNQQKADAAIKTMAEYDNSITLTGDDLQRYITAVSQISCEYCCGAKSIIFDDGKPACGCAHSYAMRGLAKYLLTKHPNDFTNDQILEELGKWKTLFFPTQLQAKAAVLKEKGIELTYINLASNKYRGVEKGVQGGMVGGC